MCMCVPEWLALKEHAHGGLGLSVLQEKMSGKWVGFSFVTHAQETVIYAAQLFVISEKLEPFFLQKS